MAVRMRLPAFLLVFLLMEALPVRAEPIAVDGRAVGLDGRGIAGAQVELQALLPRSAPAAQTLTGPDGRFELTASGPGLHGPGTSGGWAYSRSDGTFRMELEDGTYRGWVVRRGYFRAALEEPLTVDGAPVDGVELRLGEEVVLRGRILGLEPGERARSIWAEGPNGAVRQGELDQEAGYTVHGLIPGEWKITASFQGREAVARITVEEGETEVALDLEFTP